MATSEAGLSTSPLWDTGNWLGAGQLGLPYTGPALKSQTRYYWQVRTWDGLKRVTDWSAPAWFETGMLNAADWAGAQWIGPNAVDEASRWKDYTADFTFTIDSLAFGATLRSRFANQGLMWQISIADGTPRFRPQMLSTNGTYNLLGDRDISSVASVNSLKTAPHTLSIAAVGNLFTTKLDGQLIDTRDISSLSGVTFGPIGMRTVGAEEATVRRVRVTQTGGGSMLDTDFSVQNPFTGGDLVAGGLKLTGDGRSRLVEDAG